jgi:hypothetical protein
VHQDSLRWGLFDFHSCGTVEDLRIFISAGLARDDEVTSFFQSLKKTTLGEDGLLLFECEEVVAGELGMKTWEGQLRMLVREEYKDLWAKISARFFEHADCYQNSIITGTSGIGKSVFRWYVVWMWMKDDPAIEALQFKDVRVNIGEDFYLIEKDGTARKIEAGSLSIHARHSLALFDPCSFVQNRKKIPFKMIVITSSPSHVVGQVGKISLTECSKLAIIYVMALWSLSELRAILPTICPRRLDQFGLTIAESTYCVPRWFFYSEHAISGFVSRSWTHVCKDALRDYFLKGTDDDHKNKNFPYRLCTIAENGYNDWKVTGFISSFVAEEVYSWAKIASHLDRGSFVNLLNHPLGGGLIGAWYERWALECLELKTAIVIADHQFPERKEPAHGKAITCARFQFESLCIVEVESLKDGKEPISGFAFEPGVLYKPRLKCNPSIDAWGITKSDNKPGDLILLQFTKALSHSSAQIKHLHEF